MNKRIIIPTFLLMFILSGCGKTPSINSNEDFSNDITDESIATVVDSSSSNDEIISITQPDIAIEWQDERFESFVRDLIGKPEGIIMTNDLSDITELDCSYIGISSAYDLVYFKNLKEANFSHNSIIYFTYGWEEKLPNLISLDLSYNNLNSINCTNIPNLEYLNLQNNEIQKNLNGLSSNIKLKYLNLNNAVATYGSNMYIFDDLSAISGLTELTHLDLGDTGYMKDTSCISSLVKLEELNLENSYFTDLDEFYIKNFKNLTKLNLANNKYIYDSNYESVGTLTNLKSLSIDISRNEIDSLLNLVNLEELTLKVSSNKEDLSFIQNFKKLRKLTLIDAYIEDPSFIAKLTNLVTLDVYDCEINGTDYLANMIQLEELSCTADTYLSDSFQVDLSKLVNLHSLKISLRSKAKFSLAQLKEMKDLNSFSLVLNDDFDGLDDLKNYPQIKTLSIFTYGGLNNFDFLYGLTHLTSLTLYSEESYSADYSSMKALTNLTELTFLDNQYGSSNILEVLPHLTTLRNLALGTTVNNFKFLEDFKELETLTLASPSQDPVKANILAELPNLKTLNICNILLEDISVLTNSQSLRTIYYPNTWDYTTYDPRSLQQDAPQIHFIGVRN